MADTKTPLTLLETAESRLRSMLAHSNIDGFHGKRLWLDPSSLEEIADICSEAKRLMLGEPVSEILEKANRAAIKQDDFF